MARSKKCSISKKCRKSCIPKDKKCRRSKSKSRSRSKSKSKSRSKSGKVKFYDVAKRKSVMVSSDNVSYIKRTTNGKNGKRRVELAKGKIGSGKDSRFVYKIVGNTKA